MQRIPEDLERDVELDALGASLREAMREVLKLMPNLPRETAGILDNVRESGALADLVASNLTLEQASVADKQKILETFDAKARVRAVLAIVQRQLELLRVKKEVSTMVADEGRAQREAILRQQMRRSRRSSARAARRTRSRSCASASAWRSCPSEEREDRARSSWGASAGMQPQSAEYNVTRTYLEWLADVPWSKTTPDKLDVEETRRCLDEDHYGLEKIKKRIVEYMAVRKLARQTRRRRSCCFIGPPGVGKTSLGRSIARSMGRRYHRIALGGVRDEAEIRGHRRTYVGALPGPHHPGHEEGRREEPRHRARRGRQDGRRHDGRPLGRAARGARSRAELHVPGPLPRRAVRPVAGHLPLHGEQPRHHPRPALGPHGGHRVPGYTRCEKLEHRARVPVPQAAVGPRPDRRAARVRPTRRSKHHRQLHARSRRSRSRARNRRGVPLASSCGSPRARTCTSWPTPRAVEKILGAPRYLPDLAERTSAPGVATGLAWTPCGGDILFIEATKMPGKGDVLVTGNLKSVMRSARRRPCRSCAARRRSWGSTRSS